MRALLALALIGWIALYARGALRRVAAPLRLDRLTESLAAAGLGLGLATLVPFWVMLIAPGGPAFAVTLLATTVVAAAGALRRAPARATDSVRDRPPTDAVSRLLRIGIVLCCASLVFTSVYWPFDVGDALALYAPFAKHLYTTATLPIGDRLYEAYPMLVPMAYALTHWAAGGVNEYLARVIPAAMAVGVVGIAAALGRAMGSARTGLWAAGLVALTPIFGRWASTGYVDIPAAFYVGLAVLFAWHWWRGGSGRAIALSGLFAGLACWTKNSALAIVPSGIWLVLSRPLVGRRKQSTSWRSAACAAVIFTTAVLLVAGPWYVRSQIVFGFAVPPTMLTDRVDHSAWVLAMMLRPDQSFGVSGLVFTLAPLAGAIAWASGRDRTAGAWYLLLVFLIPFYAAWWWMASYEARFLMTVIPVFAALGALSIDSVSELVRARLSPRGLRRASALAILVVLVATAVAWRRTLMHKRALLDHPWPTDVERHQVRIDGYYDLVLALNGLPKGARIGGVPAILRYYLTDDWFAAIDSAPEAAPPGTLADRYDAVVYHVPPGGRPPWTSSSRLLLETSNGYRLYATKPLAGDRRHP